MHQSAIRSITWILAAPVSTIGEIEKEKNPTIISTGGYDGCLMFLDLREGHYTSGNVVNRARGLSLLSCAPRNVRFQSFYV